MDEHTRISCLAEAKTIAYFIKDGFDVFTQFSGKAPFDLVVHKDEQTFKVEVKSTTRRTKSDSGWIVEMKSVRSNKNKNVIYNWDNKVDWIAFYIAPIDKLIVVNSDKIKCKSAYTILD